MGRLKQCALAAFGLLATALCLTAQARTLVSLRVEQVWADLPDLSVYFYAEDADGTALDLGTLAPQAVDMALGGETLTVQDAGTYDGGTAYFYLIDVSTSMPAGLLEEVKTAVTEHLETRGEADQVMVLAFGEDIQMAAGPEDNLETARARVEALRPAAGATRLYDGIAYIADYVESNAKALPQRKVVFVVTDGVDFTSGGNTRQEVLDRAGQAQMALYSFGVQSAAADGLETLGEIARASGGRETVLVAGQATRLMRERCEAVSRVFYIRARAATNRVEKKQQPLLLQLETEEGSYSATSTVTLVRWQPDRECPRVVSAARADDGVGIVFSEPVDGMTDASYLLSNGKENFSILRVEIQAGDRLLLHTKDVLPDGEYTLSISGGWDRSMEANPLSPDPFSFTLMGGKTAGALFFGQWWWCFALGALLLLVLLLLFLRRKNKENTPLPLSAGKNVVSEVSAEEKLHLRQRESRRLQLAVAIGSGVERRIEVLLDGSLILGRSPTACDLSIEDPQLSRQHCALTLVQGELMVQDLGSTNGTSLNGIPIRGPRAVGNGDVITVGSSKVVVRY